RDKKGGLADHGGIETFGRAVEADIGQGVAQDLSGLVEEFLRGGQCLAEVPTHADFLGALAGKEKGYLGHRRLPGVCGQPSLAVAGLAASSCTMRLFNPLLA